MSAETTPIDHQMVERMRECIRGYIRSCPLGSADPVRLRQSVFMSVTGATNEAWLEACTIAEFSESGRVVLK